MAQDNTVTIVGNITRDPEMRYTNSGTAVVDFGLAWNRRWQRDGEWEEEAHFFDVTAWAELGENVAESYKKGDRVVVLGRLDFSSWEDKESGDKRSKVKIVADDVSASVRWATVDITRIEKASDDGGSSRGGSSRGGSRDSGSRGSRGSSGGGRQRGSRSDESYDGEEPF